MSSKGDFCDEAGTVMSLGMGTKTIILSGSGKLAHKWNLKLDFY